MMCPTALFPKQAAFQKVFEDMDVNKYGAVSQSEFAEFVAKYAEANSNLWIRRHVVSMVESSIATVDRAKDLFNLMDRNKNGLITKSEIIKFIRDVSKKNDEVLIRELRETLGLPGHVRDQDSQENLLTVFNQIEADGDKQISMLEFVTFVSKSKSLNSHDSTAKTKTSVVDAQKIATHGGANTDYDKGDTDYSRFPSGKGDLGLPVHFACLGTGNADENSPNIFRGSPRKLQEPRCSESPRRPEKSSDTHLKR